MRAKNVLGFVLAFVMAAAVLAQSAGRMKAKTGFRRGAGKAKAAVIMPAGDLKWVETDPKGAPGVKVADLWGNHEKGAYGSYMKFPAGFAAPLHTHTYDMKIAIVSGTFIHGPEGKPEVRLGPGSYLMQPGGYRHTTACDKASECVFFTESPGKFDLKVVGEGKAPAKM